MIRPFQRLWPLARRYPFSGICAALSVFLALASVLLWLRLHSLTAAQPTRQAEGDAVTATLISAPQLRQELAFAQQTIQRITDNLTSEESLAANTNYFLDLAERCEVRLDPPRSFNTAPPETGTGYKKIPFGLRVSGTFPQLAAFIHAVETGPRLSNISYFVFRKPAGSSQVVLELNVDLLGKK
ncbi:MAG: type 4a pilus biogenesis protein PilO [Opitutaceae bacterium]